MPQEVHEHALLTGLERMQIAVLAGILVYIFSPSSLTNNGLILQGRVHIGGIGQVSNIVWTGGRCR